ncbi:MAG TPA: GMC family oxidoreductase [Thermoanaerobaculia bacterium]|jgi:choline dehydrogenase-like flavoprotein|nr:GMC family oxidoreductase [Thermoanaerobaculia bacterium]
MSTTGLDAKQQETLRAVCDTYVPGIKHANDRNGFWARSASSLGANVALEGLIVSLPPPLQQAVMTLLDSLGAQDFAAMPLDRRTAILRGLQEPSALAKGLATLLQKSTMLFTYGLPTPADAHVMMQTFGAPTGQNPMWEVMGYPGPITVPRDTVDPRYETLAPDGDSMELEADVCVVGSGAGGCVLAARLAERGRRVVVLEQGGQYTADEFYQHELWSYQHLWFRGGATPTADGNVLLMAGATLGGGTEINWMNCVPTPQVVRDDWVRDFDLAGVDGPEFERYVESAMQRIQANQGTSLQNDPNLRMKEGCDKLGYLSKTTYTNWDPRLYNPLQAGYTGLGDQTGGKQTARRTTLRDAYENGARIVVHCQGDKILVENGRAAGVEANYADPQGRKAKVTVRAPIVIVACGSLESPALLLRSGIGGPAVGKHLHVQPGGAVYGVYEQLQRGWWGSPMTANCEEFTLIHDGWGFYMEIPAFGPGFVASVIPWRSGHQHKEVMTKVPYVSTSIWFLRDRSDGSVILDATGQAVINYALTDPIDQQNFRQATAEAIRIHEAAGAQEIYFSLATSQLIWKRGQSLDAFIRTVEQQPLLDGAQPMISAHQLSSCRMGPDPATSVANTDGELHDVKGVWMGDASACPTSLGANPMVTIMALAERTADKITGLDTGDACQTPAWIASKPAGSANSQVWGRDAASLFTLPLSLMSGMVGLMFRPLTWMLQLGNVTAPRGNGARERARPASPASSATDGGRAEHPHRSAGQSPFDLQPPPPPYGTVGHVPGADAAPQRATEVRAR